MILFKLLILIEVIINKLRLLIINIYTFAIYRISMKMLNFNIVNSNNTNMMCNNSYLRQIIWEVAYIGILKDKILAKMELIKI